MTDSAGRFANVSSLPMEEADVAPYVKEFVASREEDKESRIEMSLLCEGHYNGNVWYRMHQHNGLVYADYRMFDGVLVNDTRRVIDMAHASMIGDRFISQAYASSNTEADIRAADAANAVLQEVFYRTGSFAKQQERGLKVLVRGDHFVKVEVDPSLIDQLVFESEAELNEFIGETGMRPIGPISSMGGSRLTGDFQVGHIAHREISPNLVVVPNGIESFDQARRFAVVYMLPIETIRLLAESEGADPELIKPVETFDRRRPGLSTSGRGYSSQSLGNNYRANSQSGHRLDASGGVGMLTEYVEQDSNGYWMSVYIANKEMDVYVAESHGLREHGYVHFPGRRRLGEFWGAGMSESLWWPQVVVNKMRTLQINQLKDNVKDFILAPKGSAISSVSKRADMRVVEYNPHANMAPQHVAVGSQWANDISAALGYYERMFLDLAGVSQIMAGNAPDRISSETAQLAGDFSTKTLQVLWAGYKTADEELARKTLYMAKQSPFFSVQRIAAGMGAGGRVAATEFKLGDLSGSTRIRAKAQRPNELTQREMMQSAKELAAYGFFESDPASQGRRDVMVEWIRGGETTDFKPRIARIEEAGARTENELFRSNQVFIKETAMVMPDGTPAIGEDGQPTIRRSILKPNTEPMLHPAHNHELHIAIHTELLQELIANPNHDSGIVEALQVHIQEEHQPIIDQQAAQSRAQELQQRSEDSVADTAGQMATTQIANAGKAASAANPEFGPSSPRAGGFESGRVRASA